MDGEPARPPAPLPATPVDVRSACESKSAEGFGKGAKSFGKGAKGGLPRSMPLASGLHVCHLPAISSNKDE